MTQPVDRRQFLTSLGVTVGALTLDVPLGDRAGLIGPAAAQESPRGRVPDTPVKFGHITILSGPGAVLGAPSLKGHT